MKSELTLAQRRVLNAIKKFSKKNGFPPSRKDIQVDLGFKSANAVQEVLVRLKNKGIIELHPNTARGLKIV